jgi:exopolysaccharide biosynthesis protein
LSVGSKVISQLPKIEAGTLLELSTATTPSLRNVHTSISGGPPLVVSGKAIKIKNETERHPRAAFGWNDKYYFFMVVDGRRAGISDGMTLSELGNELAWWGCTDAMNLDGGGSAMLWADGKIRNQPSENRERPTANALVVVRKSSAHRRN